MFQGVVPKECIAQILRVTDCATWGTVYNCCSGTFRFEQITLATHPHVKLYSNDVSLYSSAIAGYVMGRPVDFRFTGKLEFIEEIGYREPDERLAALAVGFNMGRFGTGKPNLYKTKHYAHYQDNFATFVARTLPNVRKLPELIPITSYAPRDWLDHIDEAIERKAAIFAYPPFYKGGYEKMFEFLNDNTAWAAPGYKIFDPADLRSVIDKVRASGVPFCILSDQVYDDMKPELEFVSGRGHPHYCYVSTGKSSYLHLTPKDAPFRYTPIDMGKLGPNSVVTIAPADAKQMTFLKNVYLKKGIIHTPGMMNFLVMVDGMLIGGLIYSLSKYGIRGELYLLSDFAITREGRASKLIARLAANTEILRILDKRYIDRFTRVATTAFSDHPVSMKYRGIFELHKRSDKGDDPAGRYQLQYQCDRINETLQDAYKWWWKKYGSKGRLEKPGDRASQGRSGDAQAA